MMICHCSMAGTQACKNCPRYNEYFGEQIKTTSHSEMYKQWINEEVKKAIAEAIEKENERNSGGKK